MCKCACQNTGIDCKDFMPKVVKNYGVYNPNYKFVGTEVVVWGRDKNNMYGKPYCKMNFHDGTSTYAFVDDEDLGKFDLEFGVMICEAKKFIKGFNFKKLYNVCKDKEGLKVIIKEMLKISQGKHIVVDLEESSKRYNMRDDLVERIKNKKKKTAIKLQKRREKIEELKKQGKWIDKKEIEKARIENEKLKQQLAKQNEVEEYKKMLEENEKMKKQLGIKE